MKLTNEICISFLRGSGWLYNHDKDITISERNKAIDDFAEEVKELVVDLSVIRFKDIDEIAEQLKAGGENEYGSGKVCRLSD